MSPINTSDTPKAPLGISAAYKAMESYNPKTTDDLKPQSDAFKASYGQQMNHKQGDGSANPDMRSAPTSIPSGPLGISAAYKSMESYKPTSADTAKPAFESFKTDFGEQMKGSSN